MSAEPFISLSRLVDEKVWNYEACEGREPTKLLLGKKQMVMLAAVDAASPTVPCRHPGRARFMDLALYEADDETFIGVC